MKVAPPRLAWVTCLSVCLAACASQPVGLSRPNGVAPAPDGGVYVMDFGNYRLAHASAEGKFLSAFGSLGQGPDQIYFGWDLAIDPQGNLYICNQVGSNADTTHDGIKVFTPAGKLIREVGGVDYSPDAERIYSPYGLDVDSQGRVYTADFGAGTVRVFDSKGQLLAELFGRAGQGEGEFKGLSDVAVDDTRGWLYASDNLNSRVQQFKLAFEAGGVTVTQVRSIGTYGRLPGQFAYPQNLAVDESTGHLYVGDVANRRIQVFDSDGNYLSEIDKPATVADWQVMGLNVGADGALYAADGLNSVVWVFAADGILRSQIEAKP
jgi:DNA-binding beta-propeller fold protein YncE